MEIARFERWLLFAAVLIALLAACGELLRLTQARRTAAAQRELSLSRPLAALEAIGGIWTFPYDPPTEYTRLIALKRLARWQMLSETADEVRSWHPQQADVLRLKGEADWRLGRNDEAARILWASFRLEPVPRESPAQLWRIAMRAAKVAWGVSHPRTRAAARQVLALLPVDLRIPDNEREKARLEATELLAQSDPSVPSKGEADVE